MLVGRASELATDQESDLCQETGGEGEGEETVETEAGHSEHPEHPEHPGFCSFGPANKGGLEAVCLKLELNLLHPASNIT